jgi:hypothetical protein
VPQSIDSTDARWSKGSYTLPLHLQRQQKTIHGSHFTPVHGNRYGLKETSDDLAQKFRNIHVDIKHKKRTDLFVLEPHSFYFISA